jgi:hypothetical protein
MRNKLSDLNDHLFAEIERLGDEELKGQELVEEIGRAQAVAQIATKIVENGTLVLKAKIAITDQLGGNVKLPLMLE